MAWLTTQAKLSLSDQSEANLGQSDQSDAVTSLRVGACDQCSLSPRSRVTESCLHQPLNHDAAVTGLFCHERCHIFVIRNVTVITRLTRCPATHVSSGFLVAPLAPGKQISHGRGKFHRRGEGSQHLGGGGGHPSLWLLFWPGGGLSVLSSSISPGFNTLISENI